MSFGAEAAALDSFAAKKAKKGVCGKKSGGLMRRSNVPPISSLEGGGFCLSSRGTRYIRGARFQFTLHNFPTRKKKRKEEESGSAGIVRK